MVSLLTVQVGLGNTGQRLTGHQHRTVTDGVYLEGGGVKAHGDFGAVGSLDVDVQTAGLVLNDVSTVADGDEAEQGGICISDVVQLGEVHVVAFAHFLVFHYFNEASVFLIVGILGYGCILSVQSAKQIFTSVVSYIQCVALAPSVLVVGFLGGELDAVPLVCANVLGCAHEGLGGSNNVGCILVQFFLVIRTRLVVCVCSIDGFNQGICFGIACPVTYVVANNQHFRVTLVLRYGITHFSGVVQNGNKCFVSSCQSVQVVNGEVFICSVGSLLEFCLHVGTNFAHGLNLRCADGLEQLESTHVEESAGSVVWTLACLANQTDVLVGGVQSEAVGGNFHYTVGPGS